MRLFIVQIHTFHGMRLSRAFCVQCTITKVKREEHLEIAFGYSFEKACLFARSLGIGTVMLAASLSRSAFEKAMDVQGDEVLPVASPVGYPAEKRSIRDNLMRKGMNSDKRIAYGELFFEA